MPTRDHRFRTRIDRLIYRLKYQYSMGSVGHSLDFSTKARRRHFNFFFFVQHRVAAHAQVDVEGALGRRLRPRRYEQKIVPSPLPLLNLTSYSAAA